MLPMPIMMALGVLVAIVAVLLQMLSGTLAAVAAVVFGFVAILFLSLVARSVFFLGKYDQLRVEGFTERKVLNGPGVQVLSPFGFREAHTVEAEQLGTMDYLKVKDAVSGQERVEKGPQLLFLGPYDVVQQRGTTTTLSKTEYVSVENKLTGERCIVKGPRSWFPANAHEMASSPKQAIALQEDEFIRLKDDSTGERWVQRGKALVFLEASWRVEGRTQKAWTLKAFEYVRLLDSVTGKVTVHRGEKTVFPGPDEDLLDTDKLCAIDLKVDEYVKIEDQTTGEIRVTTGTDRVFLGPAERTIEGGKKKAVQIDEEHAVLVRETSTGQVWLATEKQLFFPGKNEVIEEVRKLIKLEDHEAMIVKDKDGNMNFHYGEPQKYKSKHPRSFFLQPYSEVVQLWWSSGLRRKKRDLKIERFDCRAQYMWFEFDCRTSDNVELILEVTMFWDVLDLPKLIRSTGNLPGDIYNQARSQFIKHVAHVTLKEFMGQLHTLSSSIHEEDQGFYDSRGVKIHSLEVTRYNCAETRTSEVLQQIIEETTNRLNRLSKAESENEVAIFKMQGEIEQGKLNTELLVIKHKQSQDDARVCGAAEADRVAAFMKGLAGDVPKLEDRLMMWQVLRKTDALSVVAEGGGNLYYTPNDVDLSIRTDGASKS